MNLSSMTVTPVKVLRYGSGLSQIHIDLLHVQTSCRQRVPHYEINKEYSKNEYAVHAVFQLAHVPH
jgi:hypothetical protein